ncbi:MAG: Calx-beta domain-containing protein [Acutalibacteraceae bacterium]|nr:Calx-beta domain-containing protein [Acutalibacteraceae bacterium]
MKKIKHLKKHAQRSLSFFLAMVVLAGFVPTTMVKAEENELTVLQSIHSDIGEIDEAYSYFSIGTVQSSVEERGKYALTIYRDGNTNSEASVELKSVDVSAKYAEDYIVLEKATQTEEELTDKTLLEMVADEENQKKVNEIEETFEQAVQESIDTEESDKVEATENKTETPSDEDKEKSEGSDKVEATENKTETPSNEDKEKSEECDEQAENVSLPEKNAPEEDGSENKEYSSLAELKAMQTGLPTRETWDNEGIPLESLFLNNTSIDPGQEIITSSTTTLVFAPGETEKLIVFEILEDKESEGQEIINFLLSAPDEMSALSDYISIAISINDDEPIEYSEISFSKPKYESSDDNVVITAVREKALYSFVTARVHSNEIGEAETGVHFAGVNGLLEFAPYQKEVSFEIPVRPEGDMSFELVLGEVKGGVEGECSTAKVYLSENEANKIEYSENKPTLHLASSKDSDKEIVIDGKTYELEGDGDASVLKIMDSSKNPKVHVGDYYLPIPVNKASGTGADVENTIGNVEYGFTSGDSGRQNNGYNIPDKYGHLCWYSGWVWDKGAEIAKYQIPLPQYQYLALDCETLSEYESSECGMKLRIRNTELNKSESLKFARKGQQSRQVSTPVLLVGDPNGKKWIPDTWDSKTIIDVYAEKTAQYLVEPEIKFWGVAAMFRQFDITLVQPDAMKYLNGDVTVQKAPARVVLPAGHDSRYVNQDLSILYSSIEEGGSINGELIGYDVKFGNASDYYRYETTDTTLSFSGDFLAFVDEHIGDSIEIKKKSGVATSYVSKLTIKPAFKYKDVRVEINPSEYGTFDNPNLKKTTTDVYHVGDTIKLSATSYEKYKDYQFESYESEAYVNPGDTKPEESGVIPADYELTFKKIRYTLKPVFSQQKNIIEVQLDDEAQKYFTVTNIVPKEQLTYTDMKGKNVICIDDPLDGENHTRPVYGKVYEVSLAPTALNDGTYRPRITQSHTGDTVNGYFMYVRAYERADKNVINVSAERCDPNDYQAFTLEGYARYSSVTLRQSVAGISNQPATNVIASTATINQKVYDSNKNLIWGIQKYSGKNKIVTEINEKGNEISKVLEGSYEINGI